MRIFFILSVIALSACAPQGVKSLYQADTHVVRLWSTEAIRIENGWRFAGQTTAPVRGELWESDLIKPLDQAETAVFVQDSPAGAEILLVGRIIKTHDKYAFIFLGGQKVDFQERDWREATYGLRVDEVDAEMRRYLDVASENQAILAKEYSVHIMDRLPLDTVLVRVIHLKPGSHPEPMPTFAQLYPQERKELLRFPH